MKLGCQFHTQDEEGFCGAAVAMMAATVPSANLTVSDISQRAWFISAVEEANPWGTAPSRLARLLNERVPHPPETSYRVEAFASAREATLALVASLQNTRLPAAVPYKGYHWILVDGFELAPDKTTVETLHVLFPVDADVCKKTHRHFEDDACGKSLGKGGPGENVAVVDWIDQVFQASEFTLAESASGLLAVLATPVGETDFELGDNSQQLPGVLLEAGASFQRSTRTMTPEDHAVLTRFLPVELLESFSQGDRLSWLPVRGIGREGAPDRGDYMLGAVRRGGARYGWLVTEAESATIASVSGRVTAISEEVLEPEQAVTTARQYLSRAEGGYVNEHLAWRLCRQSRTPELPFWVVRFEDLESPVYVRVDGKAFAELTNLRPGG